jgi:hypothetical protein
MGDRTASSFAGLAAALLLLPETGTLDMQKAFQDDGHEVIVVVAMAVK